MLRRVAPLLVLAKLLLLSACSSLPGSPSNDDSALQRFGQAIASDYRRGYSADGLLQLVPHIAVHAGLANTNADLWIRTELQQEWRSEPGDDFTFKFMRVGDYSQNRWSVPIYSITMLAAGYDGRPESDSPIATWAERSLRANILGGPQGWALTYMLGTHRPDTGPSDWNPWNDNDGVSGHSIYGAIPFLTAARMADDPGWKAALYITSTLPALARVYRDAHYTSQAYLGWAVAYVATGTVAADDDAEPGDVSWLLLPLPEGVFAGIHVRF